MPICKQLAVKLLSWVQFHNQLVKGPRLSTKATCIRMYLLNFINVAVAAGNYLLREGNTQHGCGLATLEENKM